MVFKSYYNKKNFTQISNFLIRDDQLSIGAKIVYIYLLSFAWDKDSCFVGRTKMMKQLSLSKPTIIKYLKELKKAKLVSWVRRSADHKPNIYTLLDGSDKYKDEILQIEGKKSLPPKVKNLYPNNTQYKNTQFKKEINKEKETPITERIKNYFGLIEKQKQYKLEKPLQPATKQKLRQIVNNLKTKKIYVN